MLALGCLRADCIGGSGRSFDGSPSTQSPVLFPVELRELMTCCCSSISIVCAGRKTRVAANCLHIQLRAAIDCRCHDSAVRHCSSRCPAMMDAFLLLSCFFFYYGPFRFVILCYEKYSCRRFTDRLSCELPPCL